MPGEFESRRFKVLLAVAIGSATLSIGLVTLFLLNWTEIQSLRAELLAQSDLQSELLKETSSDHVLYPHISQEVGIVLNPHLGWSTWRAARGQSYRINSLGLRGDEIVAKAPGTRRLLLVGDSVLFGWKLADADTIETATERLLARQAQPIEVITVALPNWNVRSQNAFLEAHLPLLAPDFIVWSVLRNDFLDVAGAIPPGVLQGSASPQARPFSPLIRTGAFHRELDMPFVRERWKNMIKLIQTFGAVHDVPVAVMQWRAKERPYFEYVLAELDYDPPLVTIPKEIKSDPRWAVTAGDPHPSPWATGRIAVALAGLLVELGWLPEVPLMPDEAATLAVFREDASRRSSREEIDRYLTRQLEKVPGELSAGDPDPILVGLGDDTMLKEGVAYLRGQEGADSILLDLELPSSGSPKPLEARFDVFERAGGRTSYSTDLPSGRSSVSLPLPATEDPQRVFEVRWEFGHSFCEGPERCHSARLHRASFSSLEPSSP